MAATDAVGEQGEVAAAGGGVPAIVLLEQRDGPFGVASVAKQPGQVEPGGGGQPTIAVGHGLIDRPRVGRCGARIARPLLHPGERGPVQRGLAEEAHGGGFLGGAFERPGGIVEAVLGLRDAAQHGVRVHEAPRIAERGQDADRFDPVAPGRGRIAEHQRSEGSEQQAGGGRPAQPDGPVRGQAGGGGAEGLARSTLLDGQESLVPVDVRDQQVVGQLPRQHPGPVEVVLGQRHIPGRRLQPAGEQQAGRPVASRGVVDQGIAYPRRSGRPVAEHHPGPAEPVDDLDAELRIVGRAPGEGDVDVGPLGSRDRQAFRLPVGAHVLLAPGGGFGVPRRRAHRRRDRAGPTRATARTRTPGCCRAAGTAPRRPPRCRR